MQQLIIASKPLITVTRRAYETQHYALKLSRNFTHDKVKIAEIDAEIATLEELITHSEEVLSQL